MKSIYIISTVLIFLITGCQTISDCEDLQSKQAIFLLDVSDDKLFAEIEQDIKTNLPAFMQRTGLANTGPCERFTLGFAHLSGKDDLDIEMASIGIEKRNQSKKVERLQKHPAPIISLVKKKLSEYKEHSSDPDFTSGSYISNQLIKSLLESEVDGENTVFIFSDMVENNNGLRMYKGVPKVDEVPRLIPELIDEKLLREFKEQQQMGVDMQVYLVLKQEPAGKIEERKLRVFWTALLTELEIDFQIIDNLSVRLDR